MSNPELLLSVICDFVTRLPEVHVHFLAGVMFCCETKNALLLFKPQLEEGGGEGSRDGRMMVSSDPSLSSSQGTLRFFLQ